jgi:hypothetical protein
MRYQPVHVAKLFTFTFAKDTGILLKRSAPYFTAMSTLFGSCGHKHRSATAASPCLEKMKELLKERRRKAAKRGSITRRENYIHSGVGSPGSLAGV